MAKRLRVMKQHKKGENVKDALAVKPWPVATIERLEEMDGKAASLVWNVENRRFVRSRDKMARHARRFAAYLDHIGVSAGDKVVVDSPMCAEIPVLWLGILYVGATPVFLPCDARMDDVVSACEYADARSASRAVVVASVSHLLNWNLENAPAQENLPIMAGRRVVYLGDGANLDLHDPFANFASCLNILASFDRAIDVSSEFRETRRISDNASIATVYTQGSRVGVRCVELPNHLVASQAQETAEILGLTPSSLVFCDAPSVHSAPLIFWAASLFAGACYVGATLAENESPAQALASLKPTHAFLRPCFLDAVVESIRTPEISPLGQKWRSLSLKLGKFRNRNANRLLALSHPLIRAVFTRPVKEKFFPKLDVVVSYGNHFDSKAAELLDFLDLKSFNAYTMAELGIVHMHGFKGNGAFLKSVEARVKNGNLFVRPKKSNMPFLDSNDLVFEDARCGLCSTPNLALTLENGQTVDTSPLREILMRQEIIEAIFIFGQDRSFLTALIYLDVAETEKWAKMHRIHGANYSELAKNPEVYAYVRDIIQACNLTRAPSESIQKMAIIPTALADDAHIVTPCQLVRFPEIEARYASIIESFYVDCF